MKNIQYAGGLHHTLAGYYRVSVVDGETNETVWEQPELQKNLILNQGMDIINSLYYSDVTTVAISGDGPRLNYINPAGSMLSQAGTTVTLVPTGSGTGLNHLTESFGNYSIALAAGDVIQYATGSGGVTTVIVLGVSDLTASVNTSLTISPSQSFTIWKTTQTGLQHELQRSSVYLTGTPYCGSTTATGSRLYYRTYDFLTESVERTYQEVGVGWSAVSGSATVFSRVVLDTPVTVAIGQRLRVFYQLNVGMSPTASVPRPNVTITGWPVSPSTTTHGSESIQTLLMSSIDSSGNSITSVGTLDPASFSSVCSLFISHVSTSLQPFGSAVDRTGTAPTAAVATTTKLSYTNGSYTTDKTGTFSAASWDGNNIRSMGFGYSTPYIAGQQVFAFVFEQSQSKSNTQTLTLAYRWTWDRSFIN
jgi:hypothetical protein